MGPFVDAWLSLRENTLAARHEARERFLTPLLAHCSNAGLGHVSEVADAQAPHRPDGCPFQAWSVAELLRLTLKLSVAPATLRPGAPDDMGKTAVAS
jgi:glycogen debranching enzyme